MRDQDVYMNKELLGNIGGCFTHASAWSHIELMLRGASKENTECDYRTLFKLKQDLIYCFDEQQRIRIRIDIERLEKDK